MRFVSYFMFMSYKMRECVQYKGSVTKKKGRETMVKNSFSCTMHVGFFRFRDKACYCTPRSNIIIRELEDARPSVYRYSG